MWVFFLVISILLVWNVGNVIRFEVEKEGILESFGFY